MMSTTRMFTASAAAVMAVMLSPLDSSAQAPAADPAVRRPYRGLFGGTQDSDGPQSLLLNASFYGAYDENILAKDDRARAQDLTMQRSGSYLASQVGLDYTRSTPDLDVSASGGALVRQYPQLDQVVLSHRANAHALKTIGKTKVGGAYRLLFTPNYQASLFGPQNGGIQEAGGFTPGMDLFRQSAYRHTANVSLSQALGRRTAVNFAYSTNYVAYSDDARQSFRTQGASGHFTNRLTSNATLVLGYGYRAAGASSAAAVPASLHDIDAGVNYSRGLSISRRTSLSFSSGSSLVLSERVPASESRGPRVRLTGNAALTHEMGRTWTARAIYRRGSDFHDGFERPVFTDGVTADVAGLMSRRWNFSASAQWTRASLANATSSVAAYQALYSSTQLRYALTRMLAADLQYTYLRYEQENGIELDAQIPRATDRHGVRLGLSLNVPFIR